MKPEFFENSNNHVIQVSRNQPLKRPVLLRKMVVKDLDRLWDMYRRVSKERSRPGAWQWLYDNFYTLQAEGRSVLRVLRQESELPCVDDTSVPMVYRLIDELFVGKGTELSGENLEQFLTRVQQNAPLSVAELCFLPTALRCAFISLCASSCEKQEEASEKQFAYGILSIRGISDVSFEELLENQSVVEKILQKDPTGQYAGMDDESKNLYRCKITRIAAQQGVSEKEAAEKVLLLAQGGKGDKERHIGEPIFELDVTPKQSKNRGQCVLILSWLLPLILSAAFGVYLKSVLAAVLLYLPLWEILRPLIELYALRGVPVSYVPRMQLKRDLPEGAYTLVTVSTLLPRPEEAKKLEERLENLYITNGGKNVGFMLLADFKEDKSVDNPKDKAMLSAAQAVIGRLNARFGGCFFMLVRKRSYNKSSKSFGGWERKRGAITQLVRLIHGESIPVKLFCGSMDQLKKARYILALDADTGLLLGTVPQLVGAALHPLNHAEVSDETGTVTKGYGIFSPRICVDLDSAYKTGFSKVMAGSGGITAYSATCGNLYQDLFGQGIFSGKGLIDVKIFHTVMDKRFEEGRILSHDILEGEYMRTAYISDVELTENFPRDASGFFSRLHRWIRGDVQNLGFIFSHMMQYGVKQRNVLGRVSRFKLFDNIRRAITPILALACIIISFFGWRQYAYTMAFAGFLAMTAPPLLAMFTAIFVSRGFALSREYYSKTLPTAAESLSQAFFHFVFLPKHAFIAGDAVIRSLYRMAVSKEKLLQWTTAAEADQRRHKTVFKVVDMLPGIAVGTFLLFSGYSILRLFGVIFLLAPFVAVFSSRENSVIQEPPDMQTADTLTAYAAMMWRYYDKTCTARDNFLPPDNVQEAPTYAVAHRTSPTNIGLMLLCTLAARDLHFITSEELLTRIEHTITTVERMEKFHGNLYNWYDTKNLALLQPAFVSTVDSANFVCCLIALKEGIKEYCTDTARLLKLTVRLNILIDNADLTIFYNKRKKLFSVGYECETEKLSHSHYDLLMSEARLTSYLAIAKEQVPKKHWGALERTLARQGAYAGPVSWGGSIFEYFMPHLLLPVYEGSLLYEALRFAIYCQRLRAKQLSLPWGVSESGFYAFDNMLNYRYKAHGVQKVGLMRGLNTEYVVSPYSTFLTMQHDLSGALRNLSELEKIGMLGKWGFYEACDYTSSRTGAYKKGIVRSYMAHHVGMSLLSVCNVLNDNCMQRRFMADKAMKAAQELLKEKIAVGSLIFEDVPDRGEPPKHGRDNPTEEVFREITPITPHLQILSNGELTLVASDCGAQHITYGSVDITRRTTDLLRAPFGTYFTVQAGDHILSATAAPFYDRNSKYTAKFTASSAEFYGSGGVFEAGLQVCVGSDFPGCQYIGVIKNNSSRRVRAKAIFYLEPALAKWMDVEAHPAFTKMFIQASYDRASNTLVFTRRTRPSETDVSLAAGFLDDTAFEYETVKPNVLELPYGISSLNKAFEKPFTGKEGIPDAVCAIRVSVELPPNAQKELAFMLMVDDTPEGAISRMMAAKRRGVISSARAAKSPVATTKLEDRIGQSVLPLLFYPKRERAESMKAAQENALGVNGLWGLSISGDFPIVLFEAKNAEEVKRCEGYIRLMQKLRLCGVFFDLVIAYHEPEGGGLVRNALYETAKACTAEDLIGARVGIHAVNLSRHGEQVKTLLYAAASHVVEEGLVRTGVEYKPYHPADIAPVEKAKVRLVGEDRLLGGAFTKERFYITGTPKAPWCHILANPAFGTLVSDKALGFSWAINSRENKLTPWFNDLAMDNIGEMLLAEVNGRLYDLVDGALTSFSAENAVYEGIAGNVKTTVTVTVSKTGAIKYCDVSLHNTLKEEVAINLAYYTEPVLGVNRRTSRYIVPTQSEGRLLLHNPYNTAVGGNMALSCDKEDVYFNCDRAAILSGSLKAGAVAPSDDPCAAIIHPFKLPPSGKYTARFILSFGMSREACEVQSRTRPEENRFEENRLWIDTPDKTLNHLFNVWLPHQISRARLMGRTGYYQCGGAWGFRDQLQDVCAYLLLSPKIAKQQIIRAAGAQFKEGDVLHWWHNLPKEKGGKRGVRTRYSDDLVWLPYTVCEYLEKTGDEDLLAIPVRFLSGDELTAKEHERYFEPQTSDEAGDIYEHCCRAIDRAVRLGEHGLPLIGCGDWNDGFNLVGVEGKGESVWLALFLAITLERFAFICDRRKDTARAEQYRTQAALLKKNVDEHCYDGGWYLRAFYDDGSKMGSVENDECRIDSLPQSFAVFADLPDKERVRTALLNAYEQLTDRENGIVRLFTPSFQKGNQSPGYVKAYPCGLRENGGQYTHAAVWLAQALLKFGLTEQGYELLCLINPANKYKNETTAEAYRLEPYYIAADVYTNPSAYGRGGWSIYTGAAGWYYRTVFESLLGVRVLGSHVEVKPKLPEAWDGFSLRLEIQKTVIKVTVAKENKSAKAEAVIPLDGKAHEVKLKG